MGFQIDSNLLPYHGQAFYYQNILYQSESYLNQLRQYIEWQPDVVTVFGKKYVMNRMSAWYGSEPFVYTYSGLSRTALPFTDVLLDIKQAAEDLSKATFNSCLLNFYHDGSDGMGWHSDNEKSLKRYAPIASVSLGAARKFVFKHRQTKEKVELLLANGSLLLMAGTIQDHWLHSLPKTKKVSQPRINLTFRTSL